MINHSKITNTKYVLTKWHIDKWKQSLRFIKKDSRVFDIGCADCSFFDYLSPKRKVNMYGFDVDTSSLSKAKQKGYTIYSDLRKIKCNFDVITMWEMIEHIPLEKFIEYLNWCKLHLTENGLILISTPNILNIFYPFWAEPTHIRPYCLNSLKTLLESDGFEIVYSCESHPLRNPLKIFFSKFMGLSINSKIFVAAKYNLRSKQ
ncbi:MAG: class I SAM-dependent methyltransferase [Candidatus Woesearchaeota archaeon]